MIFVTSSFSKSVVSRAGVFKFLQFEERFRKAPIFCDGLVWTVRLT